jgi:hypothetical protein
MKRVLDFLKKAGVYYLATIDRPIYIERLLPLT